MQEYSYGIIPLKWDHSKKEWEVLLIQHHAGHWAFPKGHANPHETPEEAAERELFEETGLTIDRYLSKDTLKDTLKENYTFFFQKKRIYKTVYYFIAQVKGEVVLQQEEIKASRWIPLSEAAKYMTFQEGKNLCTKTHAIVSNQAE